MSRSDIYFFSAMLAYLAAILANLFGAELPWNVLQVTWLMALTGPMVLPSLARRLHSTAVLYEMAALLFRRGARANH